MKLNPLTEATGAISRRDFAKRAAATVAMPGGLTKKLLSLGMKDLVPVVGSIMDPQVFRRVEEGYRRWQSDYWGGSYNKSIEQLASPEEVAGYVAHKAATDPL